MTSTYGMQGGFHDAPDSPRQLAILAEGAFSSARSVDQALRINASLRRHLTKPNDLRRNMEVIDACLDRRLEIVEAARRVGMSCLFS